MNLLKEQAKVLRNSGYSYNMIHSQLGISKSTLSNWFRDLPFKPNREVIQRIQYGPMKSAERSHNRKVKEIEELLEFGSKEIGKLTRRDLWMIGLGIYIGEGTKSHDFIRLINADPDVIRLALKWFREIIGISNENISVRVYLYPDNNEKDCLNFWKSVTGLSDANFFKSQIDRRQNKKMGKRRKLPYGTAHVSIKSNGNKEFGVRLFRRIKGWIHGALSQV